MSKTELTPLQSLLAHLNGFGEMPNLIGVDLYRADLSRASLREANLREAGLSGAKLENTTF